MLCSTGGKETSGRGGGLEQPGTKHCLIEIKGPNNKDLCVRRRTRCHSLFFCPPADLDEQVLYSQGDSEWKKSDPMQPLHAL